jgi:predicted DNA-binding antitoxin AbrB/MazE fold protein
MAKKIAAATRVLKETPVAYSMPLAIQAVYRNGHFEPSEPLTTLDENQTVELIVRTANSDDLQQRAIKLVQRAKVRAAHDAQTMTAEESWAEYDRVAAELRRALRRK